MCYSDGGTLAPMCSTFFHDLRGTLRRFYVDKTKLIEQIVVSTSDGTRGRVHLVLRPRRCGKSTMLQMLKSFFSIPGPQGIDVPEPRLLFKGLYIASKQDICTKHMGKYPVISCDFKNITGASWVEMRSRFEAFVARLYRAWKDCLMESLDPMDKTYYDSICSMNATDDEWADCLYILTSFLAGKFRRRVVVLIDEYDAPINCAYDHDFFDAANEYFGRGVLPTLLKSNEYLLYALLAGVTPAAKSGWYSGLNNLTRHALHTEKSLFAGMLMFTEPEVERLKTLSNSELEIDELRAHYNSYIAAGHIRVYNPVSVMSALASCKIESYWLSTGEYPLLKNRLPTNDDLNAEIEKLLSNTEVQFDLMESVIYSKTDLSKDETLTLLYYAGYLTMRGDGRFIIPNREVMSDWARWIVGNEVRTNGILKPCLEGPVSDFEATWPNFMQQHLHPKQTEIRGFPKKTPEKIYQVFFLGLMLHLRRVGWDVAVEKRANSGFADFCLFRGCHGVLIELKSSYSLEGMKEDADMGLEQIVSKNYRNPESLPNVRFLREYGIGCYRVDSYVKGRYLELDHGEWVEKDDPENRV